jgi:galactokinase/mevalonate kinase-like predicted kinase
MRLFRDCVIVASNRAQAARLRGQVDARVEAGLYPREVRFHVTADPDGGRVGSGGAAILAAHSMRDTLARGEPVLVINAGGESRRLPAYAAEGKLFAPLPFASSSIFPPVVLDQQLGFFLRFPWEEGEMLVSSGDVAVDFDTDGLGEPRGDVCGFAQSGSFEVGSRHGVFKLDRARSGVVDFFQKESVDFLRREAALEGSRTCAVDTGVVGFSPGGVQRLHSLGSAPVAPGTSLIDLLGQGSASVDLYVELLMSFLGGVSFERYREKVRPHSRLGETVLAAIHSAFSGVDFRAHVTRGTRFLHFGSLAEYPDSCEKLVAACAFPFYTGDDAELRPVLSESTVQFNSVETTCVPQPGARHIYLESCERSHILSAGGSNMFIGLRERTFSATVPAGICIDERGTPDGTWLLVYGSDDTWRCRSDPHDVVFCGVPIDEWAAGRGLALDQIFPRPDSPVETAFDLWDAHLYAANTGEHFVEGYWSAAAVDDGWREQFLSARRRSLREISDAESLPVREERRMALRRRLLRDGILGGNGWLSVPAWDFCRAFGPADTERLTAAYRSTGDELVRLYRSRVIDRLLPAGAPADAVAADQLDYLSGSRVLPPLRRSVKIDQIVWARSPVRLDLAGGWTDTPPFTLREGGEVVNVAVNLNDQPPIQVFCRPTEEPTIRLHSIDLGAGETVREFGELAAFRSPGSPFALPKAALTLLGLTAGRAGTKSLADELRRIGCGIEISLLSAVPKGSGLGTSSILGATILASLERFFGLAVPRDELFRQVLQLELMLTTGGGWQDQIGGVVGGVKYIASSPGLRPRPVVDQLDPFVFEEPECASRFTLYYTGITRLAKDILQDVVGRANSMEPSYLFTLRRLKQLARGARQAVSRRDLNELSRVLGESWEANKLIHPSTTNDEVEALLAGLRGMFSGMKLLGAGGGGYVLFLSDSPDRAHRLLDRLESIEHERARVVGMSISREGLQVTVS